MKVATAVKFQFGLTRISVTLPGPDALRAAVEERLRAGRGFALATINMDHLVKLQRSARFRAAYAAQDMVVADGNPIVWLSRLALQPIDLVPGSDMVIPLARIAARAGVGVALVGSTEAALAAAASRLCAEAPGLRITTRIAPAMGFDPDGDEAGRILATLAENGTGLCFLALGAPKQEALAARGRTLAPQVGFASVGAGLDFLAGTQQRAPDWVRNLAMEWMWRTVSDPRRMVPRYAACAAILPGQMLEAWRQRQRPALPQDHPAPH